MRNSLGHVDDETGRTVVGGVRGASGRRRRGRRSCTATYDRGVALPLGHSSIWLRSAGRLLAARPRPSRSRTSSSAASATTTSTTRDEKRYREYYAFPGAELNEIGGRNFVKSLVEWNLPPLRFRRAGTPGFYATWMRPAMFVGGLVTNLDDARVRRDCANGRRASSTCGSRLLSALDLTLSVGGARRVRGRATARAARRWCR